MSALLKVEGLSKDYLQGESKVAALKDVSFQVEKGETLAIVGTSGSGKTTLLSLLAGLEEASSGKIWIGKSCLSTMSEKALSEFRAQQMGIVFQEFHLMSHLTALENVSLPLEIIGRSGIRDKAAMGLEQVGLGHRLNHRPGQLSGGECQRVAIARALVARPQILLADEPSGNLDTETGDKIMKLLFDLVATTEMTLILVTHNPKHADLCKRHIILDAGQIR